MIECDNLPLMDNDLVGKRGLAICSSRVVNMHLVRTDATIDDRPEPRCKCCSDRKRYNLAVGCFDVADAHSMLRYACDGLYGRVYASIEGHYELRVCIQ